MAATRQHAATESVALEIDARIVRGEAIRAIRGFASRSGPSQEPSSRRSRPISFYAIVRIMRDLELTLAAISGSLAEGVEHATGGQSTIRDHPATPHDGGAPAAPAAGARPTPIG